MRETETEPTVGSVIAQGARWLGRRAKERKAAAAAAVGALLLLPLLGWIFSERRAGDVPARRLTLAPSVALAGTLSPTLSDSYGAAVPGVEVKILWLVEEGTLVARGDKLIQFDPAPFQKELDTARARAQELSGEADQARLAVQVLGLKETEELEEKKSAADRSQRELSTLVNTTAPLTAQESANDVEMRERFLQEAQTKLDGLEPFVAQGYVSQEEYRAAVTRRDQAAADLKLAQARYSALVRETNPDLIRRKSEESQAIQQNLSRQAQRGQVERAQAEASARVSQARLAEATRQIAEAEKKIAACTVLARAPGLAVHSEVFDKGGERRKIRVGDAVWGGTTVVTLPDLSHMQVEGRVPESEIHLLAPGQKVVIRLDAFPSLELTGALKAIGSVSASEKNESRTFPVTVSVDQTDPRFRPGMIARCSILCRVLENVVALPIEAVRSDDRGPYVLVVSALGAPSRRAVKLGASTSRLVEVRQGLKAGEVVRVTE